MSSNAVTNKNSADQRNLKQFSEEQSIRQRPAPTFGTSDEVGAVNSIDEITANSADEAREGHGDLIKFNVRKPTEDDIKKYNAAPEVYIFTIEDDGRGLPMKWNPDDNKYNWELALCTLYATGKSDTSQYSEAVGLNGLGLTATQYASRFMNVWSSYDGETYFMEFRLGKPVGDMKTLPAMKEHGTKIEFQPDPEVFKALYTVPLSSKLFINKLNSYAMLQAGLVVEFTHPDNDNTITFYYPEGKKEFVDRLLESSDGESTKLLTETVEFEEKTTACDYPDRGQTPYDLKLSMAINFKKDFSAIQCYHNGSFMSEGGTLVDGFQAGIAGAFTDTAKGLGKLGKSDKFLFKDIEQMLVCVLSSSCPGFLTEFKNQTKCAIKNIDIGKKAMAFVYNKLRFWFDNNKKAADRVIETALMYKKAREEGDAVSKKVISNLTKSIGFGNKPAKFHDCKSKNVLERELFIVEGDSALGSVLQARDSKFQAAIPIRGKIINCLKENLTRVLNSDVINDLYRVLGCGIEIKSKYIKDLPPFDITKLQFDKIIITTDADVDGNHIQCLLLDMFYVLSPSLLRYGKVYIAMTPLYEISYKGEIKFAYSDKERDEVVNYFVTTYNITTKKVKIQRSKGLGENDADMMAVSTMNPATRKLIQIEYPENETVLADIMNALLGDDLESRRVLIDEYFSQLSIVGE